MHSIIVIISGSTPSYSCQNGKSRMYVPQRVVIGDLKVQTLQILSSLDKQYALPIQDFRSHLMVYLYIFFIAKSISPKNLITALFQMTVFVCGIQKKILLDVALRNNKSIIDTEYENT